MNDTQDEAIAAPTDCLRDRVLRGIVFVAVAQVVRISVQFVSVIVLSRLLTPKDFGVIAMISPLISFVNLLQGMGLASAIANSRQVTYSQLSTVFWINAGISAALCALVAVSAPLAGAFYDEPAVVGPMMAMAVLIFIAGLGSQHTALINRQMRFGQGALVDASSSILALAVGIGVAVVWPTPWALVSSLIAASFVSMLGGWWVTRWRPGRPASLKEVASFLHFGRGITGFQLANFFARNLDNILIGRYAGAVELGLYDRAYKLLLLPVQQSLGPVSRVLLPVLSRLADDPGRYRLAYTRAVQQILLCIIPGVVWLLINAQTVIPTLLGEQWVASVPIFQWLGYCALIQPLSATTGWLFISQHRTDEFAAWGIFVAITCVAAFVAGLPWGAIGVAAAYTLSEIFLRLPVVIWLIGRKGPISAGTLCRLIWPNAVANAAAAGLLLLLPGSFGVSILPDLVIRLVLAYAASWTVLALFPEGRRAFTELARSAMSVVRPLAQVK
jgi:PST family polysaccharide transporter